MVSLDEILNLFLKVKIVFGVIPVVLVEWTKLGLISSP